MGITNPTRHLNNSSTWVGCTHCNSLSSFLKVLGVCLATPFWFPLYRRSYAVTLCWNTYFCYTLGFERVWYLCRFPITTGSSAKRLRPCVFEVHMSYVNAQTWSDHVMKKTMWSTLWVLYAINFNSNFTEPEHHANQRTWNNQLNKYKTDSTLRSAQFSNQQRCQYLLLGGTPKQGQGRFTYTPTRPVTLWHYTDQLFGVQC